MLKFDPDIARAARVALGDRLESIAALYVPDGYTVEYRKRLSGRHFPTRRLIQAPRPRTRKALYIFLHECAHAQLMHQDKPVHVKEHEAEVWAHEKMREHGIPVPRDTTRRAKAYVGQKIEHPVPFPTAEVIAALRTISAPTLPDPKPDR